MEWHEELRARLGYGRGQMANCVYTTRTSLQQMIKLIQAEHTDALQFRRLWLCWSANSNGWNK